MEFTGTNQDETGYCMCKDKSQTLMLFVDKGYWDVCLKCDKPIRNSFHDFDYSIEGKEAD